MASRIATHRCRSSKVPSTYQSSITDVHSAAATWVDTSEPCVLGVGGEADFLSKQPARTKHMDMSPTEALNVTGRTYSAYVTIP
jgi:hypothetical protein